MVDIWGRNTMRDLSLTSATSSSIYYHFAKRLTYLTNHQFCDIYNKYISTKVSYSVYEKFNYNKLLE